jgi:hypothetical protein
VALVFFACSAAALVFASELCLLVLLQTKIAKELLAGEAQLNASRTYVRGLALSVMLSSADLTLLGCVGAVAKCW